MEKGKFGYLNKRHTTAAIRTSAFFAFTLFLVLMGRVFLKEYQNVFIIAAIVSVLPAAMSAVHLVMYLRYRTGRQEIFDETESVKGNVPVLYDCVFTSEKESYGVNAVGVINKNLILFSEAEKFDSAGLEKHLSYITKKNGFKSWTIKTFTDLGKFTERLKYLKDKDIKLTNSDKEMIELIKAIIL